MTTFPKYRKYMHVLWCVGLKD